MSRILGAGLLDQRRILHCRTAQNQTLHAHLQQPFNGLHIADAAAKLHRNFHGLQNAFNNRHVLALTSQRTVKVNKVQPFGPAVRPLGSHLCRVVSKNRFGIEAPLCQTHAATATDIYCRIYNHNFPLITLQNFSTASCRHCSTSPDGTERPAHCRVRRTQ